jgi:signal transduction histidine kinase
MRLMARVRDPSAATSSADPTTDGFNSVEQLLRFERLVSDLSASFINLPAPKIDAGITAGLERIVKALGVDRSTLTSLSDDGHLHSRHSWGVEGVPVVPATLTSADFPWALSIVRSGKPVVFTDPDELPVEAAVDKALYRKYGLRSHVILPIIVGGELIGTLGLGTVRFHRQWPRELVERLQVVAQIFASALARKHAHEELEQALRFEQLLVNISTALLRQDSGDSGATINAALEQIGEFLDVDRAVLWSASVQGDYFEPTHLWVAEGVVHPPTMIDESLAPMLFRRIAAGEAIALSNLEELTTDAAGDREALAQFGTRSLFAVPLYVGQFVVGALSLSCVRGTRVWPESLVPRVRLIGEAFASVLARERYANTVTAAKSETAQYRERLAHLVRVHTVGEMSAAIAHEVNQPLMAIENYAHAVRYRLDHAPITDAARIDELLGKIGHAAARAGDVLKRLRSIVKKHESEATEFDLGTLVTSTVGLVEIESRLQDVRIEVDVEQQLPLVLADEVQIQQVLLNLARNGIEAMREVPQANRILRVEASRSGGGEIAVRVRDSGRGITARDAEHLFEPFYTTKEKGLGIGLAICRSIVEAHGGKLRFLPDSTCGAIFEFTLPSVADDSLR